MKIKHELSFDGNGKSTTFMVEIDDKDIRESLEKEEADFLLG